MGGNGCGCVPRAPRSWVHYSRVQRACVCVFVFCNPMTFLVSRQSPSHACACGPIPASLPLIGASDWHASKGSLACPKIRCRWLSATNGTASEKTGVRRKERRNNSNRPLTIAVAPLPVPAAAHEGPAQGRTAQPPARTRGRTPASARRRRCISTAQKVFFLLLVWWACASWPSFFWGGASFRGPGDLGSTLGLPRQGDKPAGGLGACKRSDLVQWLKCFILESPTRPQAKCRMKT